MFNADNDWLANVVFEDYDSWIVQDQTFFTWLLSTIYEAMLQCSLPHEHAYEVRGHGAQILLLTNESSSSSIKIRVED